MQNFILLNKMERWQESAYMLLRIFLGAFLIWGVWDNIISAERMLEFEDFLKKFGFIYPEVMARLSVMAQFLVGVSFVLGLMVRWFSIVCIINFIIAIIMVDGHSGIRGSFPSAMIIMVSILFLTKGAGILSFDRRFFKEK